MRDLPDRAEGYFLSLHTRSLPDYKEKIQGLAHNLSPMLVTDGFASLLDAEFLERPNVQVIEASVPEPHLNDHRRHTDPYDMQMRLRPIPRDKVWGALADDTGWDVSMRYAADPQMAAKVFSLASGLPEPFRQHQPELLRARDGQFTKPTISFIESLRDQFLEPFDLTLRGPMRVSLHPLGKEFVALHNFNDHAVTMGLGSKGSARLEPVVTLPGTARTTVRRDTNGFTVDIEAHSLTCLRRVN